MLSSPFTSAPSLISESPLSSAQLRQSFESLPQGYCKEFVRGRADQLLRQGQSMETAMQTAIFESFDHFPEVWVVIRAERTSPESWEPNDIGLAVRAAVAAMEVRVRRASLAEEWAGYCVVGAVGDDLEAVVVNFGDEAEGRRKELSAAVILK